MFFNTIRKLNINCLGNNLTFVIEKIFIVENIS